MKILVFSALLLFGFLGLAMTICGGGSHGRLVLALASGAIATVLFVVWRRMSEHDDE